MATLSQILVCPIPQIEMFTDSSCQITNNIAILLGVIATVIISLVFYLRQNKLQNTIDSFVEAYIVRTCLQMLRAIFAGGDDRIKATDENRMKYVKRLNHAIKRFHLKNIKDVTSIQKLADTHFLGNNHNHESCKTCEELLKEIVTYLKENQNPFE